MSEWTDLRHWKIRLGAKGFVTKVEVDGKLLGNVVAVKVEAPTPTADTRVSITVLPQTVEVEGLAGSSRVRELVEIVGQGTPTKCSLCDDPEPSHVHGKNGERIDDYFTVGRRETEMVAANRWKERALRAERTADRPDLYIVFDGPPAYESGRFVEVETERGIGVRTKVARWQQQPGRSGFWRLGPFKDGVAG